MQLPKLTLITPKIQSGDLFPALELVMSSKALEEAIAITNSQEKRASNSPNLRYCSPYSAPICVTTDSSENDNQSRGQ